jgi:RIO kinase 1
LSEDLSEDQRWSTWGSVERLCRGPEPHPDWVVTSLAAIDTDLGTLKSGKEADVNLVRRAVPADPDQSVLMAAKRYRTSQHRMFHRDTVYTEGRRVRNSRDTRAMARKTVHGRAVEAGLWAQAEWTALQRLYEAGVPVPYPVQLDGLEILMEYITTGDADDGTAAPRLHQYAATKTDLASLFEQLRDAMRTMARLGVVHGDLSPYNALIATGADGLPRLVIIDVPQLVDLIANPSGIEFLHRDCTNMAQWFTAKGHQVNPDELLADLLAHAW